MAGFFNLNSVLRCLFFPFPGSFLLGGLLLCSLLLLLGGLLLCWHSFHLLPGFGVDLF